jgi:TolB-like protein
MRHKPASFVFLVLLVLALIPGGLTTAKEPKRMAILPFVMNADRDLSFLQEGITDMLASRLAWKGEVDVLEKGRVKAEAAKFKGPLNRETALTIGKNLQADYVILGSLTVFGDSVSIDAKILDVAKAEELITAFNQAKGMDAVIPTVTQFAQDINEKVMSRPVAAPVRAATPEAPKGPGGLIGSGQDFEGKGVSHTQGIRAEIVGMDVGDVDGDGKNELVLISPDTVYVYKWTDKGFVQFKTVKQRWATHLVYLGVADLDGNGKAEMYVSNAGETDVSSFVAEWDGGQFRVVAEGIPWFLRVIEVPGKGKALIGQKREAAGGFLGDVQFLAREGNRFTPTGPLPTPAYANIFNFALGDFGNVGRKDTIMLDTADYLILYEGGKEEIWRSEDYFGGTYTFIQKDNPDGSKDNVFISSPIYVVDVDGDGQKELMVCKNTSKIGRLLARFRLYSGGAVYFMTRDQSGLSTKWTTKRLGGAIVGYRVADVDNDNLPELIVVSVIREDRMYGNPRSRIVVYDLK